MPEAKLLPTLREALTAARANDKARTRELLKKASRIDAASEPVWHWLAGIAECPTESFAALEKVLALNPQNERAQAALGPARLEAGVAAAKAKDVGTARRLLRQVVADDPDSEQGWMWLAAVCDSPAEGQAHLCRVLAINPNNKAARKGLEYYRAKLAKAPPAAAPAAPRPATAPSGVVRLDTLRRDGQQASEPNLQLPPITAAVTHRLLVVDESRTIRKLVVMSARPDGFEVVEASGAMEAADRILEGGPPDVALVDAGLPGVDGYELCRLIRLNPGTKSIPLIIMTSKGGFFDTVRGAAAGVTAALAKPLDPAELLHTLRAHCPVPSATAVTPPPRDA
jgi:twitching motility two-component system response regulator PilG